MEVSRWKRRRFIPTWGDNDNEPEPCVIVFAPPSVGWMARWRELALQAPSITAENAADPEYLEKVSEWSSSIHAFRDDMLADLVLAIESLTLDGKAVSREEGLAFILDNEGLREEVFLEIISEGTLTVAEGKG